MTSLKTLNISIIIPTLNEENLLEGLLTSLQVYEGLEIIVADGGSTDRTTERAISSNIKVVSSSPGRSLQQNTGAKVASHDTLLFLHADTRLPEDFPQNVHAILDQEGTAAGAFRLKIDSNTYGCRLVEWGANIRSNFLQLPYGDQALFMRKKNFEYVGGFPAQSLLEDLELVRKLKRIGKIRIAPTTVITSARRWKQKGVLRTTLINQFILLAYKCGADPVKLERLYYASTVEKGNK